MDENCSSAIQRKRLKVVNACEECRRKKTKCNGECPCVRCIKSQIDCKYAFMDPPSCQLVIESIEERLSGIEATLRAILQQQQTRKTNSSSIQHLLND